MQAILENGRALTAGPKKKLAKKIRIGLMTKLFGCWHQQLSRPFTTVGDSYRACLQCGARRNFNPETLETSGAFYFAPEVKTNNRLYLNP